MKQLVIVGGGFAGLRLARQLRKQKNIHITLINPTGYFRYSPALYRAATGVKMSVASISLDWALIDNSTTRLLVDTVVSVDDKKKIIKTASGQSLAYDYAVFALGSVTTYFGIEGIDTRSFGIKTKQEVDELKQHIHTTLTDTVKPQNYVVIGAGATGVELAGALGTYLKQVAKKHNIKHSHISIYLVEAGPRILSQMHQKASKKAHKQLRKLGVHILTDTQVKAETAHTLKTSNGTINTNNVIWTAGATNNPFFKDFPHIFPLDKRGKVSVNRRLAVSNSIYVCGDSASTQYSGLAYTAIKHANFIAKDIKRRLKGKNRPYAVESPAIQVVPAGSSWAAFQYKNIIITGYISSLIRKIADYIGYSDVLGHVKAFTIWRNGETSDVGCEKCTN